MQTTEVTQAQWRAVMAANPSGFTSCGATCPVENVSWDDIQEFLRRLNAATGRAYRLPTEAEWEYAARAGTTGDYGGAGPLDTFAWTASGANETTHPVGSLRANAWGLYDLHGNVWEWVQHWFGDYTAAAAVDPTGPTSGFGHVLRGGSWRNDAIDARAAARNYNMPSFREYNGDGFRLARTP